MGIITRYLKAVLGGAKNESQTEEKQGFGKDVQAWLKEEKKCRRELASELRKRIREKFEKNKLELKEDNNSKKEECEKKEKWKRWCKFFASIAYGIKLTVFYVLYLSELISKFIAFGIFIVIGWLLIWGFFLAHWAFGIIFIIYHIFFSYYLYCMGSLS